MPTNLSPAAALNEALLRIGGQSALARVCEKSQSTVWKWTQSDKGLPAEYVLRVEAITGVSRHVLRPDIYPVEVSPAPPAFQGVDRGDARVSFQNMQVSQRNQELGAAA